MTKGARGTIPRAGVLGFFLWFVDDGCLGGLGFTTTRALPVVGTLPPCVHGSSHFGANVWLSMTASGVSSKVHHGVHHPVSLTTRIPNPRQDQEAVESITEIAVEMATKWAQAPGSADKAERPDHVSTPGGIGQPPPGVAGRMREGL